MYHSINILLTLKNTKLTIEDTFLEIQNETIRHHNRFESSTKFLFENNKHLENIFNFEHLIENENNAININVHVKDENLGQCLLLLKNKINKELKQHFNAETEITTVDNRTLKEYNIEFENIFKNADNAYSFDTNFKSLNKKDYKNFVEYFENQIKSYEELQKSATIDYWIKINHSIMPCKGILKIFSEGIENFSLKDKISNAIKIRSPKNK